MKLQNNRTDIIILVIIDPGHFHAALLQKKMYEEISPLVYVYGPSDKDVNEYLNYIETFNTRSDNPANWKIQVYTGHDFLEKAMTNKAGNLAVLAGNNKKRIAYILQAAEAGFNVLADKPLIINKNDFIPLQKAFRTAEEKDVLLYDIMTERSEITNILQKELCSNKELFGELIQGSKDNPAIIKESVHHFFKTVNDRPIIRPDWYFDIKQTGEGIVDVTTHLIDLAHWGCFAEQKIDYTKDIAIIDAAHWATKIDRHQFRRVTGLNDFPLFLHPYIKNDILNVYANGFITYKHKNHYIKVKIKWHYEAEAGKGDRHASHVKGTRSEIIIRQKDAKQPQLYVKPADGKANNSIEKSLKNAILDLQTAYAGVSYKKEPEGWHIIIPHKYRTSHETHFSDVVKRYLQYYKKGELPDWEIPNMLTKYFITTSALEFINRKE